MGSTFHGLEVARRSLSAQQSALYTTGHNIANANTEGYSRQRVSFEQTTPYPPASRNRPQIAGQVGTGVEAGMIERVRNEFLDVQYRGENAKLGYYEAKTSAMQQMESVMNEPSEHGLAKTMDRFGQALQDLSVNPENSGARSVVKQRGIAVAETFNYLSNSLQSVRADLKHEMGVTKTDVNSLINQIDNVNKQVGAIEPNGYLANDLYDERDRLIDQLSKVVDIKVSYTPSGGNSNASAMGQATITMAGSGGANETVLIDSVQGKKKELHIGFDANNNVNQLTFFDPTDAAAFTQANGQRVPVAGYGENTVIAADEFNSQGKLKALIESNGYVTNGGAAGGIYPEMLADLDKLAYEFATEFNNVHGAGKDLNGNAGTNFFEAGTAEAGTAGRLAVNNAVINNTSLIAASKNGDVGDGSNAATLAATLRENNPGLGSNTSVQSFYESMIGDMAVTTQETNRLKSNVTVLRDQVEKNKQSVSGVSLDEEMTNMIKFQHAYNAAARNMTTVDEMLDTVINRMGRVGR